MDYQRSDRVGDLLIEIISKILQKDIRDPRIGGITLTGARVSRDLRHARIYFSILDLKEKPGDVLAGLKSATGFIRAKVAKQLNLRFVPAIEFLYDQSEVEARRIDQLLNQVKR